MDTYTTCAFCCLLRSSASQPCLHTQFTHQKARRLPQTLLSALGAMATSEKRPQPWRTTKCTLCTKTLLLTVYAYTYNHIVSMNVTCAVFIIHIKAKRALFFFYLLKRFSTFSSILLTFENINIIYIFIFYYIYYIIYLLQHLKTLLGAFSNDNASGEATAAEYLPLRVATKLPALKRETQKNSAAPSALIPRSRARRRSSWRVPQVPAPPEELLPVMTAPLRTRKKTHETKDVRGWSESVDHQK